MLKSGLFYWRFCNGYEQGIFASLGGFTRDAITEAERRSVDLWDAGEVLCQVNSSERVPTGENVVTFPLASDYQELFIPRLLNRECINRTSSRLVYIPYVAGSSRNISLDPGQERGLQQPEDTIKFLVHALTGEVITSRGSGPWTAV